MKTAKNILKITMILVFAIIMSVSVSIPNVNAAKTSEVESESLLYNRMHWALKYAEDNNIPINNFKERKKVGKWLMKQDLDKVIENAVFIKESGFKYVKTLEASELIYSGELNDDAEPDGYGIILRAFPELNYNYDDPEMLVQYIGNFKDGKYSGYGVEFEIPDMNEVWQYMHEETAEKNILLLNDVIYEGEFKKGEYSGKGNCFINNLYILSLQCETGAIEESEICGENLEYAISVGEYKKGKRNGKTKEYFRDTLIYEGNTKNGEYSGKGKVYSEDTGKLIYEGELSNGKYDGKGILYDEDGNIVHKGKFNNGDVK